MLGFGISWFIVRDVVKRREAAITLEKSEKRYSNLFQHSNDAVFMHTLEGRIIDVNHRALTHFGHVKHELLALRMPDLYSADEFERVETQLDRVKDVGSTSVEAVLQRKDGSNFSAEVSCSTFDLDGKQMVQTIVRDITERRKALEALKAERQSLAERVESRTADLRQANEALTHALTAKDEFLATMSHELRTPLAAILGQTELMIQGVYGLLNEKQMSSAQLVGESGRHLLSLINDILELSKADIGNMPLKVMPLSAEQACRASLRLVSEAAQKKNIHLQFTKRQDDVAMQSDERRLKQILVNLLSNAIKFTPAGGRVGVVLAASEKSDTVHFVIWDTGIGIAKPNYNRLFQPFVQLDSRLARQHDGAGLGLAIVARFVNLLGGKVSIESEIGKGSRFIVSLPTHLRLEQTAADDYVTVGISAEIDQQMK